MTDELQTVLTELKFENSTAYGGEKAVWMAFFYGEMIYLVEKEDGSYKLQIEDVAGETPLQTYNFTADTVVDGVLDALEGKKHMDDVDEPIAEDVITEQFNKGDKVFIKSKGRKGRVNRMGDDGRYLVTFGPNRRWFELSDLESEDGGTPGKKVQMLKSDGRQPYFYNPETKSMYNTGRGFTVKNGRTSGVGHSFDGVLNYRILNTLPEFKGTELENGGIKVKFHIQTLAGKDIKNAVDVLNKYTTSRWTLIEVPEGDYTDGKASVLESTSLQEDEATDQSIYDEYLKHELSFEQLCDKFDLRPRQLTSLLDRLEKDESIDTGGVVESDSARRINGMTNVCYNTLTGQYKEADKKPEGKGWSEPVEVSFEDLEVLLDESIVTEASGLSSLGLDSKTVSAIHKSFDTKSGSVIKDDLEWTDLKNKAEVKSFLSAEGGRLVIGVDNKTQDHVMIWSNGGDYYKVKRYDPETGEVKLVDEALTRARAIAYLTRTQKYFGADRAKVPNSKASARYDARANSGPQDMKASDLDTYASAFSPVFNTLAEYFMSMYHKELIANPFEKKFFDFKYDSELLGFIESFAKLAKATSGNADDKKQAALKKIFDISSRLGITKSYTDFEKVDGKQKKVIISKVLKWFKDIEKVSDAIESGKLEDLQYIGDLS
jgi:hypothetical protein